MRDRVRVGDFEAALLQVFAEIENRTAHKEGAFWIDHDAHVARFNEDIAVGRAIDEVHFVLQPGTTAADHRHPQRALRASLLLQKRREFVGSLLRYPDKALIANFELNLAAIRRNACGHEEIYAASRQVARCRRAISSTSRKLETR
jgi:hypothetical protein